eukprot:TRINITY_DN2786_c3_g1_i1.p1 TRINITY_DN2786_c3_g1~~TRINITY_DN2786_c3_g1_i1.p1  ORF type:complete len:290 (+),score=98.45 TRINITY_DN2786_c3_g1_i1:850-1719(+)
MLGFGSVGSIDEYEIVRHLGNGGFATVFEARQKSTGFMVAIKKVDKDKVRTTHNGIERLRAECEIHGTLRHPHVLRLLKCFEDAAFVYLVLENAAGGDLFRWLQRHRQTQGIGVPESDVRRLMSQLVSGVRYLHGRGVIHRDLKLGNLLLDAPGNLKIADFGLAVRLDGADTEQHTMCGTPSYLSPEQCEGRGYGAAVDVWSIGVVMYTLLTGKAPFSTSAAKPLAANLARSSHAQPRSFDYTEPAGVSADARQLLSLLLHKVLGVFASTTAAAHGFDLQGTSSARGSQ